jgi:hypothetical protein
MQDDVDEALELEETQEVEEQLVEGDADQENVSLQVEGQTA